MHVRSTYDQMINHPPRRDFMTPMLNPKSKVPKKHFPKWLRVVELGMWLGFAKYVLGLVTIACLTVFIGNKFPEALKYLPELIAGVCSLAGIAILYRNRK